MDVQRLIAELKGRGVYRIAAWYAAGGWALLQVADVLFPILGFPDEAITTLLLAAVVGFPIALGFAWIFDITPEGSLEATPPGIDFGYVKLSPLRLLELALLIALICLVGVLYFQRLSTGETSDDADATNTRRPSIAVMAFENRSNDPSVEYFADGLAEEILNLLANVSELDVAARTSSFYFKGKDADMRDIARQLGVAHVLEGSVRRAGDQLRVTAQLIESKSGFHIWSASYDRDFSDSFDIQDDIARKVVENLEVLISETSRSILSRMTTNSSEAHDFYLQGRNYLRGVPTEERLGAAAKLFRSATVQDSQFAEAYAGVCDVQLELYKMFQDPEQFRAAKSACLQALEINHQALPVYVALGNLYRFSGEYEASIDELNRALEIRPSSIEALIGLGETLAADNKPKQAEVAFEKALDAQSFNAHASLSMGAFLFNSGRSEDSIPYFLRVAEFMPDSFQALNNLGAAYYLTSRFDLAADAWQRAIKLQPNTVTYSNAGSSLFFLGNYGDAAQMYLKAVELAPENYENWGNLADAYRFTPGQESLARETYEKAVELGQESLLVNPSDPSSLSLVAHYLAAAGNREQALLYNARANALAPKDMYVQYQSALVMASLGEMAQAIDALENAVELGYSLDLVMADAGLTPLHGQAEYIALLTETGEQ